MEFTNVNKKAPDSEIIRMIDMLSAKSAKRLVTRTEAKRAELKRHEDEEYTESEDDQFKAVINTRHEIVVKRNRKKSEEEKENSKSHLSQSAHHRLKKLTALYSDKSPGPSSPIHKPHVRFSPSTTDESEMSDEKPRSRDRLTQARSYRLAELAKSINNWEDESDKKANLKAKEPEAKTKPVLKEGRPSLAQKFLTPTGDKGSSIKPNISSPNTSPKKAETSPKKSETSPKKSGWDNKIIQSLEAQGYQRCDSKQHLVYDYKSPSVSPVKCSTSERSPVKSVIKLKESPKKYVSPKNSAVMEMAAKYEETSPNKKTKDPTELSIMERKALFEKNKGQIILPKVPFGTPVPAKVLASDTPKQPFTSRFPATKTVSVSKLEMPKPIDRPKDTVSEAILERHREIEELRTRWDKKRTAISSEPTVRVKEQIPKPPPMPVLSPSKRSWSNSNHFNVNKNKGTIPPPPPMPQQSSSPKRIKMGTRSPVRGNHEDVLSPIEKNVYRSPRKSDGYIGLDEIKPIRISPPKPGRIYPSVSDIETESEHPESDFDDESSDKESTDESSMSLGRHIVEASRLSRTSLKRLNSMTDSENISEQESRIMHEMDDFLDEALGDASPPKRLKDSFSSEIERGLSSCPSGSTNCDSFEFTTDEDAKREINLMHTVSMYRKQGVLSTPVRKEIRVDPPENKPEPPRQEISEEVLVKERVKELENEMMKQTTIISQASQALNLCHSRIEFSGSPEQVEAEKLLLLATLRRTAAVRELERLKVEKTLKPGKQIQDNDKGDLTIDQIVLPIKPVPCSMEKVDNYVCLATCGSTVLATDALPANRRENKIVFRKPLKFPKLYPDFTISLEVYRLCTESSDLIPHEVKYGICHSSEKKKDKLRLTPQKKNKSQRIIESPAGPNAVRSPAFQLVGFAVFSLREINRTKFTLSKVPYNAPIDGSLEIKMSTQLKTELIYKGFLTLFEEISGFGAWRRRWGVLSGTVISLWAYPEHEQEKIPIDTIDLSQCHNKEVDLVSRDICARPHTFVLENITGTRYLMSADSLEDRVGWCKAINKSLYLLSAWGSRPK